MHTPAPNPSPVEPVTLDGAALARLRELDPEGRHGVLPRVLGAFEASLGRMLAQLEAELDSPQAAVIGTVSHTLKSSSASVGALRLSATCDEIERRLRGGDEPAQRHDVERLLAEGEAALAAVRAILRP
jgi:HPt (histidine-containing phosphotransfer) domain-containing protein